MFRSSGLFHGLFLWQKMKYEVLIAVFILKIITLTGRFLARLTASSFRLQGHFFTSGLPSVKYFRPPLTSAAILRSQLIVDLISDYKIFSFSFLITLSQAFNLKLINGS